MVVRMRANRSKRGMRRSHEALNGVRTSRCSCGAIRRPHRACPSCGKYGERVAIDVVARAKRAQRRDKRKTKELRAAGRETEKAEDKKVSAA